MKSRTENQVFSLYKCTFDFINLRKKEKMPTCFDTKDILTTIGIVIGGVGLAKGIWEYIKTQNWKKAEFISKEVKDFFQDADIKRALLLLDYIKNEVILFENEYYFDEIKKETVKKIPFEKNDILYKSLLHYSEKAEFPYDEAIVKSIFDNFFDKISYFQYYIDTKLIDVKDIKPYFQYWIDIIADGESDRKPNDLRMQLWKYIDKYYFKDFQRFCDNFGYNIRHWQKDT